MIVVEKMLGKLAQMVESIHSNPILSQAPGRIEVLGNHTDYNGGLVLASTINRFIWTLGVKSKHVMIHSCNFQETSEFDPNEPGPLISESWDKYVKGIFWALKKRDLKKQGVTAVVYGDVPTGAGLSSSAAFEVALTNLINELNNLNLNPKTRATIAFESERRYCQIACGIMDQFTSQLGQANTLLSIDCSKLITAHVPINPNLKLLVIDSMVKRHASDALNIRRMECQEALTDLNKAGWRIDNLSEITPMQLKKTSMELDEKLSRRVQHIVNENSRVKKAITFLLNEEISKFGELMYESHGSSRDLYEVSHPRLDKLVEIARRQEGVIGSRLTGAGFGGAVLCLIKARLTDSITKNIISEFEMETGERPNTILCEIPDGVKTAELSVNQFKSL